jgi:plastocyanin
VLEVFMRRLLLVLSAVALALVAAGCFPTAGPAWTYAPPTPSPTVDPSASVAPSDSASAAPSAADSAAPSAGGSGGGAAGSVVQVSAVGVAFEQAALTAPANTPFTIHFNNKDAGIPHNIEIKDAASMTMFKGDIVNGPAEKDYAVPALPAGAYTFNCTVHPNMTGTLTVGP